MRLDQMLFSQGFGTRRVCAGLIEQGLVLVNGLRCTAPDAEVETAKPLLTYAVQGVDWAYHDRAYLMLHKPAGYECSHRPGAWPSVYTLLPAPLRQRPPHTKSSAKIVGVQAVGRLDQDTTGLLLLSDDGKFIHRMSSPRHHVPKVYDVTTKHDIDSSQVSRLLAGVVLDDSPVPVKAAAAEQVDSHRLLLTLTEGKYHQVKRMLAAVGNRVEGLHRSRIGSIQLTSELPERHWRWLTVKEVKALQASPSK